MSAPLPSTIEAVDRELATLNRLRKQFESHRFPEVAARDAARVDELLDWRLELIRESGGV